MNENERAFDNIRRYLDSINPMVKTAQQLADRVINAADDEKLRVFEDGFVILREKVAAWVGEGCRMFLDRTRDPRVAMQCFREFLEPRLGHQMKHIINNTTNDVPMHQAVAVWYMPQERAHKAIIWWVAEASAGEGNDLLESSDDPSELLEANAEILTAVDATRAECWFPPSWLWRVPDYYGKREVTGGKAHTRETAKAELAYIHYQLWQVIEGAIAAARLHAEAMRDMAPNAAENVSTDHGGEIVAKDSRRNNNGKRRRKNDEYDRIYDVMKDTDALQSESKLKLDRTTLTRLCAELDRRNIPLPEKRRRWGDEDWDEQNWTTALRYEGSDYVKPYLANVAKRYCESR